MSVETWTALSLMGKARKTPMSDDRRDRSPKALDDFSGVLLSKVTAQNTIGVQDLDYDLLSRIYMCNDMAWTCINLVSSTAALGKLRVRTKNSEKGIEYLPNHPLQATLDSPNASMTQFDLIQAYVTHQLLFGTVTMLLLRSDMTACCPLCEKSGEDCTHQLYYDSTSPVLEIMPVHPDNIKVEYVQSLDRNIFYYTPNGKAGKQYPIHQNNMITDPFYNPDKAWYGVSPTKLLERWLQLDTAMTHQIDQYFQNGAIPSMIVSLKPGTNYTYNTEPATLVEKMKEGWMNQFSQKGRAVKSPAFIFGDIAVEKVQDKVDESVGKLLYYEIAGRVCATYGVPPTLYEMGLRFGAQRASAEQHEKDFYNRTISKILTRLKLKLEQHVLSSYNDPTLELYWDLSEMGVASFLIKDKEARIQKHWELGLVQRAKAQMLLGYEPDNGEFGDDYYRITVMGDGNTQTTNQLDNNAVVPDRLEN